MYCSHICLPLFPPTPIESPSQLHIFFLKKKKQQLNDGVR